MARGQIASALRKGGHVIYFRHATTDFSKKSRLTGQQIAALRLPIGESFASPLCRTMESVTLTLQRAASTKNEMRKGQDDDHLGLQRLLVLPVALM